MLKTQENVEAMNSGERKRKTRNRRIGVNIECTISIENSIKSIGRPSMTENLIVVIICDKLLE